MKDEVQKQCLLQMAELHRKNFPDCNRHWFFFRLGLTNYLPKSYLDDIVILIIYASWIIWQADLH